MHKDKIRATQLEFFLDFMDRMFDLYLHVIIDVPYKLDLCKLRQAMSLVATKEPLVSSRYIRVEGRGYWEYEDSPNWDIEEIISNDDSYGHASELITNPPHPQSYLPISIRLIHLRERDRLHIRLSHILTDAGGSKEFIYNLASSYRKTLTQADTLADISASKNSLSHDLINCLKLFRLKYLFSGLISDKTSLLMPADFFGIPMKLCAKTDRKFVSLHIDPERVIRLKNFGKKLNATLNDLFLTAYGKALNNCFGSTDDIGKQLGVIVTSDMRKYISSRKHLCNLSNWRVYRLGTLPLGDHKDLLNNIVRLTTKWKNNLHGLGNFLFNMAFLKCNNERSIQYITKKFITRETSAKACRIGLTNLGLLIQSKIDFGGGPCTDAFMYPPIGVPPLLLAGVSGCADKLFLSIGYMTGSMPTDTIELLVEEIDQQLYLMELLK